MDEIVLETGIPLQVFPNVTTVAYNYMLGDDDLMVSSHGDVKRKWIKVEQGDYIKFNTPLFFLQRSNGQVRLPAYEIQ